MRPALKPGLLTVWRNRDTIQIGIDPRRAIALTGMRRAAGLLRLLDGSRDRMQVLNAARDLGMEPEMADRVLRLLAAGGVLDDIPASTYDTLSATLRARLAPELGTASLAHGDADGGARTLARRQAACVRVHGASRAGLWIAALLTSAGIGLVISSGQTGARPGQTGARPGQTGARPGKTGAQPGKTGARPGKTGARPGKTGAQPGQTDRHAIPEPPSEHEPPPGPEPLPSPGLLLAPELPAGLPGAVASNPSSLAGRSAGRSAGPRTRPRRPSLVILADSHRRDLPATLCRDQVPHLVASASEAIGVVGPLVLPGRSACLRCLDLTRAERDPAWPLILAQLAGHTNADPAACDAVLAAMVAAQATAQALAFIDRGPAAVAVISGTLELVLPDWQWRRRTWQPHHECACRS